MVAWLAHDSCEVNGECYAVGGGHVARVAFAVNDGFTDREMTPESVAEHAAWLAAPATSPRRRTRVAAHAEHDGRLRRLSPLGPVGGCCGNRDGCQPIVVEVGRQAAARMSTTNTRVSVPLMPACGVAGRRRSPCRAG